MTWFKVDDGFYSSKKVMSIPRHQRLAAVGLWTMCGNWSGRELSDGVVPAYVLVELGATPKLRQALVKARLWLDHAEGGIEFHAWAQYQPTREQVEAAREKERIRKDKYRLSHRDTDGTPPSVPPESQQESQGVSEHPDPTRPDPTLTTTDVVVKTPAAKATGRGTRLPEPFIVTGEMRAWAAGEVPTVDVDSATRSFVDYWRGRAGAGAAKVDWTATWRNSLRSVATRQGVPGKKPKDEQIIDVLEQGRRMQEDEDRKAISA